MKRKRNWDEGLRCERCGQKIVPANSGIYQRYYGLTKLPVARAWHWPEDCPVAAELEEVK